MEDEYWESELDCVEECSKAPEYVEVFVHMKAKMKFDALMGKYKDIEWLAYLLGDKSVIGLTETEAKSGKSNDKSYVIRDIFIPEQVVTPGNVLKVTCPEFNKLPIIGVLHSHHGMGTEFSKTDHDFVNENHDVSLVITHGKIAGQVRWKTPCGALKVVKAKVLPLYDVEFDRKSFLGKIKKKIKIFKGRKLEFNNDQKSYVNGNTIKETVSTDFREHNSDDVPAEWDFDDNQDLVSALDEVYDRDVE